QRLDHDLLRVVDPVHDQAELPVRRLQHDDVDRVFAVAVGLDLEHRAELHQGEQALPVAVDQHAVNTLDALAGLLPLDADQLDDADLRDRVAVAGAGDDQDLDDRQRQGDANPHRGPLADGAVDVHGAADLLDVGPDDVHADAAPGQGGHRLGRREPGPEDQAQQRLRAHPAGLLGGDEALLDGPLLDPFRVDAGAVVADLGVDLAALVVGPQPHTPLLGFARVAAPLGRFDAVVDRVAHEVGQRVADGLQLGVVQLGLAPLRLQADVPAAGHAGAVHQPREPVPDVGERLQPGLHDVLLQLGGDQVELPAGVLEGGVAVLQAVLQDLVAGQDDLAGDGHQPVQQIDVDPHRGVVDRGGVGKGRESGVRRGGGRVLRP